MSRYKMRSVTFDPKSDAELEELVDAARQAAKGVKISGSGKSSGFRSAVIRYCIKHARESLLDDLQTEGIKVLM